MSFNKSRVRWGWAVKLSSQKKNGLMLRGNNSFITFSALRKRYLRPKTLVTAQNVQSKGQPLDVDTGIAEKGDGLYPLIKEKSG
jgi:hypothetical protein